MAGENQIDRAVRPGLWIFWLLVLLAVGIRIWLVATTIGTNDVIYKTLWANLIEKYGVLGAYARHDLLEQSGIKVALFPPLSLVSFKLMLIVSEATGIEYTDVFRLFQILADVLATGALFLIGRRMTRRSGRELALFYLLCPAVIFVSAFHCNTDSTMVAFMVLAAAILPYGPRGSIGSGVALAVATGIKILPLFAAPLFLIATIRQKTARSFSLAYGTGLVLIFLTPEVLAGTSVIRRILTYAGYPSNWGFSGVLLSLHQHLGLDSMVLDIAKGYFDAGKYFVIGAILLISAWLAREILVREREISGQELVLSALPLVYLAALFFAPGFGPQYLLWPIPFLLFLFNWRWAIGLAGLFSLYLFTVYTAWSGGFPWWYADAATLPPTGTPLIEVVGVLTWLAIGASLVQGVRVFRSRLAPGVPIR